ncbi:peptidoglycan DD-metalloendopeptidase family protein [Candidatus Gracilibacteria bacterium]|nr:peptidoglycan DD-metalloendopeptidase family protein [Candidatus Gracilibacteria bacterium]
MKIFRTSLLVLTMFCASCSQVPKEEVRSLVPPKEEAPKEFIFPIEKGSERITKKTFGLRISPKNSPVSPEKFSGYHTGVDFEIFEGEEDADIIIKAICSGPLLMKKWATGYGGVVAQKCELDKESVVVVYGHLKLASVQTAINTELKAGDQLGVLGKGYSVETDKERKHLHLSIHKGAGINIRGYVSTEGELSQWFNPLELLK